MQEMKFYNTYYFCNVITNILHNPFPFLTNLNEFYGDENIFYIAEPFKKYSAIHQFIEFIVMSMYDEEMLNASLEKMESAKLPIELAFDYHSINYLSFHEYLSNANAHNSYDEDDIYEYLFEIKLNDEYDNLIKCTVNEVFYILFQNRELMMSFNIMIANILQSVEDIHQSDVTLMFNKTGRLKRAHIPKWVKKAVFFRDKGRCVLCNKDLTGIINIENAENYDHIVPLATYGLNDVSNIQLLCKECNQVEKRDKYIQTSNKYHLWF